MKHVFVALHKGTILVNTQLGRYLTTLYLYMPLNKTRNIVLEKINNI